MMWRRREVGETRSTLPESRELNLSLHTVHQYTEQQTPIEKTCKV